MISLDELLRHRTAAGLHLVAGANEGRLVKSIALVEDVQDLRLGMSGALLVMPPRASLSVGAENSRYRLDVLIRQAAAHGVVGIVLARAGSEPSPTAEAVARRYEVALIDYPLPAEFTTLLLALARVIYGEAEEVLQILLELADDLDVLVDAGEDVAAIRALVLALTGHEMTASTASGRQGTLEGPLARLAGWMAGRATAAAEVESAANSGMARSRSAVLGELLLSARTPSTALRLRAEALGLALDGVHVAVVLALERTDAVTGGDVVKEFDLLERVVTQAIRVLRAEGATWSGTSVEGKIVLVRTTQGEPLEDDVRRLRGTLERLLHQLRDRFSTLAIKAGVGLSHPGSQGLRRSTAEAQAAVAIAGFGGESTSVRFADEAGLQRMLRELSTSESSAALVGELLRPLDELGPTKAQQAVETLSTYLSTDRSLALTAAALGIHRNTVVYRMGRISEVLGVDLDDAEARFALQLACRVRALSA